MHCVRAAPGRGNRCRASELCTHPREAHSHTHTRPVPQRLRAYAVRSCVWAHTCVDRCDTRYLDFSTNRAQFSVGARNLRALSASCRVRASADSTTQQTVGGAFLVPTLDDCSPFFHCFMRNSAYDMAFEVDSKPGFLQRVFPCLRKSGYHRLDEGLAEGAFEQGATQVRSVHECFWLLVVFLVQIRRAGATSSVSSCVVS